MTCMDGVGWCPLVINVYGRLANFLRTEEEPGPGHHDHERNRIPGRAGGCTTNSARLTPTVMGVPRAAIRQW
jgi:hypothetical protein